MPVDSQASYAMGLEAKYRREILFLDDMEYATPYVVTGTGADFACAVDPAAKLFGVKGLKMDTKTTTPAEDDYVQAQIQVCYPEKDLLVCRLRVGFVDCQDTKDVQVGLRVKNGSKEYLASIKYDIEAKLLYYWSSGGAWVALAGYGYSPTGILWSLFDMTIDLGTHQYLKVLMLGDETNLADLAFQEVGASTERSVTLTIINTALTTEISTVYIDNLYVGEFEEL